MSQGLLKVHPFKETVFKLSLISGLQHELEMAYFYQAHKLQSYTSLKLPPRKFLNNTDTDNMCY